jgi:predicted DNA-binding transcriptional regulator AlpA
MTDYITTADMAQALGLPRPFVTDRLVKRADFPKPALRLSQKTVLWLRSDFEKWKAAQARTSARRAKSG